MRKEDIMKKLYSTLSLYSRRQRDAHDSRRGRMRFRSTNVVHCTSSTSISKSMIKIVNIRWISVNYRKIWRIRNSKISKKFNPLTVGSTAPCRRSWRPLTSRGRVSVTSSKTALICLAFDSSFWQANSIGESIVLATESTGKRLRADGNTPSTETFPCVVQSQSSKLSMKSNKIHLWTDVRPVRAPYARRVTVHAPLPTHSWSILTLSDGRDAAAQLGLNFPNLVDNREIESCISMRTTKNGHKRVVKFEVEQSRRMKSNTHSANSSSTHNKWRGRPLSNVNQPMDSIEQSS